jgi:hypothetical protein
MKDSAPLKVRKSERNENLLVFILFLSSSSAPFDIEKGTNGFFSCAGV